MWLVSVFCTDCSEESEFVVENLNDIEREVCTCGYSFATLSVATFEPVYAKNARLIELPSRSNLSLAA